MRILYSFPYALGAPGVGTTAAQQVIGLAGRGHDVTVFSASVHPSLAPAGFRAKTTMAVKGIRIPHRLLGMDRSMALHDLRVARHLRLHPDAYDVVHSWPGVTLETARMSERLGIPALREVPNTHTANAYEVVERLCAELGMTLPKGHSHRMNPARLKREIAEYRAATRLLVPSDHVRGTFLERGTAPEKLMRHRYGFDPARFHPAETPTEGELHVVFLGTVEPRKGLHVALEAWKRAGAAGRARLSVYGRVVEGYRDSIEPYLSMPGVRMHDFTSDAAGVLRTAHALILPSFEEGSALVTYEAQGSGATLLVSEAAGAQCEHDVTGLIHKTGDIDALAGHIRRLIDEPATVARLRQGATASRESLTWQAAAERLEECYEQTRGALRA
jgi:glycosyltransferase involved in cell wall biosynthesis